MQYLIEVSVCSFLFYFVYRNLFKGNSNHEANRFYLLASLLLSFLLPALEIPLWVEYISFAPLLENSSDIISNEEYTPTFDYFKLITAVYLLGLFFNLFMLVNGIFKIGRWVVKGEKFPVKKYTIIYTKSSQYISSFLNFVFIPEDRRNDISQFELVHEACHVTQRHSMDVLFIGIAKSILWFNPIMLYYRKEFVLIHEFLADQECIESFGKPNYQKYLIQQISIVHKPVLIHTFNSLIKNRIHMINNSEQISKSKYLLGVPIVLVCLTLFSFTTDTVYDYEKTGVIEMRDTIIPERIRLDAFIDTIVTFDPTTGKETIEIVKRKISYSYDQDNPRELDDDRLGNSNDPRLIDTITIFDPETFKETRIVVNRTTGLADTLDLDLNLRKQ